uniref:ABC transmembrane type-1 domain-containing protein n=1 Tax=Aegilops tauschii subsp. strangulata TaxID=200361 RepID=A0A452ZR86_AEGTS
MGETNNARADGVVKGGEEEEKGRKKMTKGGKASFHDLFKNADAADVVLMLVGTVAALASGMSQVVMSIIFGRMVDAFGGATRDTILPRVDKVPFCFCMNLQACNATEISCWTVTGERQAARFRSLYLKSVLRQDMAFFDTEMKGGQVVFGTSADTILIQDAIGEKVQRMQLLLFLYLVRRLLVAVSGDPRRR